MELGIHNPLLGTATLPGLTGESLPTGRRAHEIDFKQIVTRLISPDTSSFESSQGGPFQASPPVPESQAGLPAPMHPAPGFSEGVTLPLPDPGDLAAGKGLPADRPESAARPDSTLERLLATATPPTAMQESNPIAQSMVAAQSASLVPTMALTQGAANGALRPLRSSAESMPSTMPASTGTLPTAGDLFVGARELEVGDLRQPAMLAASLPNAEAEAELARLPLPPSTDSALSTERMPAARSFELPGAFQSLPTALLEAPVPVRPLLATPAAVTIGANMLHDSQWPDAFSEKITWLLGKGEQSATIQLAPEQLGKLELRITMGQAGTQIDIHARNSQTADLLETMLPRLQASLEQQGIRLDEVRFSQSSLVADQDAGARFNTQDGTQQRPGQRSANAGTAFGPDVVDVPIPDAYNQPLLSGAVDFYA